MPREYQKSVTISLESYNVAQAFFEANQDQLRPYKIKSVSGVFSALAFGLNTDQARLFIELVLKGRKNQLILQQAKIEAHLEKEGFL